MRTPSLVAGGLLAAAILAILLGPRPPDGNQARTVPIPEPGHERTVPADAHLALIASPKTLSSSASRPTPAVSLSHDFFQQVSKARGTTLSVPGQPDLAIQVTRTAHRADGTLRSVEGTLDRPAAGRFIFHTQPPATLPGPFAGIIYFPSLDYGYRLQSERGHPVLVRQPATALACRKYPAPPGPEAMEIPADHPENIPVPDYQNGVVPLQSLPGATGVLYLDFDGEEGPHEGWGEFDAESWNFSNSKIRDIWERVAEDFAPFNLNVATDLQVFLNAPETSRQRCIITKTTDAGPNSGGIAYVGSFNWSGDTPCWSYQSGTKSCAESISHELGHTLGLRHDGRSSPVQTYYPGHGSSDTGWAPIMGLSYTKNLTQWSKGEYLNADNIEDDLVKITTNNNSVAYRADDHAATHAGATPLGFDSSGDVNDQGIVETNGDVDAFIFTTTTGGSLILSIDPVANGPNLDLLAQLYDETDTLLESANPADALNATLTSTIAAGTYTIRVSNTAKGDPLATGYTAYATLGEYVLSGTIPAPILPDFFSIAENSPVDAAVGTVAARAAHGANPLTWAIASGNSLGAFQIDPNTGAITVANSSVLDVETLSAGWNDPPEFELLVEITDTVDSNLDEFIRVLITVLDVNEAPSVTDASLTILEHTLVGRTLLTVQATDPDRFDLVTFAITAGDPNSRFSIDADGRLSPSSDLAFTDQSSYTLTITGTDTGTPGLSDTATVTIDLVDTVEGYVPGQVEHTFFRNLPGSNISSLTSYPGFPDCPDHFEFRDEVHAQDDGENYGRVVRAFLIPPLTGNYTFWIAGNDSCELQLSTNADPANASTIASFTGWTFYQEWNRFAGQESAVIPLVAGQAYYLEARQKQGSSDDHLSLAWEAKDGSNNTILAQEPIPGRFLAPHAMNYCPRLTVASVSIRDNAFPGTLVHDFDAQDLNPGDTHSFAITSGNFGNAFAIDPDNGQVFLADNTSLASSYFLGIRATDSGSPALAANTVLFVTVVPGATVPATGPLMEFWDGLFTDDLSILLNTPQFPDRPDRLLQLTELDSGEDNGDSYGARIRALLTPPVTGSYTFYVAANDKATLLLSTNDDPANVSEIITLNSLTGYQEWNKSPAQQTSAPITLLAGQSYFLEARLKEDVNADHLSVGWTGPGISSVTLLDSSVLQPYDSNVAPDLSPLGAIADLPPAPPPGTSLATFSATDSPFESITFAILGGNDADAFAINAQTGEVTVADPSALHPGPYALTVAAQDSGHGGYFPLRAATTTFTIYIDDADHDALPDPWELAQFGDLSQDGVTDTDLDGLSNRAEFIFGSFASDHFSVAGPEATGTWTSTTAQFSYRVRSDVWPGDYQLYHSANMSDWTLLSPSEFTVLSTSPVDSLHDKITVEVPYAGSHCLFRLGVD